MEKLLSGAVAMGLAVIALVFLRYWRNTRDRFFLLFALSFALEAGHRVYLGLVRTAHEERPLTYLLRLLAYVLILAAIVGKNWRGRRS